MVHENQSSEELTRNLAVIRSVLQGDGEVDCGSEAFHFVLREVCQEDFLLLLASKVRFLDWEVSITWFSWFFFLVLANRFVDIS